MKCLQTATGLLLAVVPNFLFAGQIGIGDFTAAAVLQDFSVLGTGTIEQTPTLIIGVDTFSTDDDRLRSSSKFGPVIGRDGVALSNSSGTSNVPIGFIDIVLGKSALRAGLYVGFEFPWSTNVKFCDTQDDLLGTLAISGSGRDNDFAAWQTDLGLIKRIRINDDFNDDNSSIIIDDFIQEIPEPGTLLLIIFGIITFCLGLSTMTK
jgi:hypothetical protein